MKIISLSNNLLFTDIEIVYYNLIDRLIQLNNYLTQNYNVVNSLFWHFILTFLVTKSVKLFINSTILNSNYRLKYIFNNCKHQCIKILWKKNSESFWILNNTAWKIAYSYFLLSQIFFRFRYFNNKYLRRILTNNHQGNERKIIETHSKLNLEDAMNIVNNGPKPTLEAGMPLSTVLKNFTQANLNQ